MSGLVESEYSSAIDPNDKRVSLSLTCMGSGFGNATMMRPDANFSSHELAKMFEKSLIGLASNTSSVGNFVRPSNILMASILHMAVAFVAFTLC